MTIAIVTHDAELAGALSDEIHDAGAFARSVCDFSSAIACEPELVFVDWRARNRLPKLLAGLRQITFTERPTSVVVLTTTANLGMVPRLLAAGATEVLFLPLDPLEIQAELAQLGSTGPSSPDERAKLRELTQSTLVGESPNFRTCVELVRQAARSDANVLLTGETGTGKEIFAQAIHHLSSRSEHRYVGVNCTQLSSNVLESELFGHIQGAFTDARDDRAGRFEYVGLGTLLLDEIGDVPLGLQAKLLRVIEERFFQRVGANDDIAFNGRLVCATCVELERAVDEGSFRADLLGRIDQFRIHIPPLRNRPIDIPILAQHFLLQHGNCPNIRFGDSAMGYIENYNFPQNVRELKNTVIQALARSDGTKLILPRHLPDKVLKRPVDAQLDLEVPARLSYKTARERAGQAVDKKYLPNLLKKHSGNLSRAADEAGIDRKTFSARLKSIDALIEDVGDG